MPESLVNRQAALLKQNRGNREVPRSEQKWFVDGIVTITKETAANVMVGGDYYDRKTWQRRTGYGANGRLDPFTRLSWDPGDIKLGQDAADLKKRTMEADKRKRDEYEAWLAQPRPKLARQIVGRIQAEDSNDMIKALADHLGETELLRVAKALEIE